MQEGVSCNGKDGKVESETFVKGADVQILLPQQNLYSTLFCKSVAFGSLLLIGRPFLVVDELEP